MSSFLSFVGFVLVAAEFEPTDEQIDLYLACKSTVARVISEYDQKATDLQTALNALERNGCIRLPAYRGIVYSSVSWGGTLQDKILALKYGNRECDGDGENLVFGYKTPSGVYEPDEVIHAHLCGIAGKLSFLKDSEKLLEPLLKKENKCHELYEWCSQIGNKEEYEKRAANKRLQYDALLNSRFKHVKKEALMSFEKVADRTDIKRLEEAVRLLDRPHEVTLRNRIRGVLEKLGARVEYEIGEGPEYYSDPYWTKILERELREREAGKGTGSNNERQTTAVTSASRGKTGELDPGPKGIDERSGDKSKAGIGALPIVIGVVVVVLSIVVGYAVVSRR